MNAAGPILGYDPIGCPICAECCRFNSILSVNTGITETTSSDLEVFLGFLKNQSKANVGSARIEFINQKL